MRTQSTRPLALVKFLFIAALLCSATAAYGQQTYVTRFDAFGGFSFLDSPHVSLFEPGFAAQFGMRPKTWYSLGFDYTYGTGDLSLTPDLLPTALQQQLGAQMKQMQAAGLLPSNYALSVTAHSKTQTFAAGPQLAYRHFQHATLFLRPLFLGAMHEVATPKTAGLDPFAAGVVKSMVPNGHKTDTTWFVGFGGGFDILLSNHFAIRTQADLVYDHLFNDLLKDGRFTTRFSVGPAFNFGSNIAGGKTRASK